MAANAYKGRVLGHGARSKKPKTFRFSASDVAAAKVTWTDYDALTTLSIPAGEDIVIDDISTDEDGEDTGSLQLVKGASDQDIFLSLLILNNTTTTPEARCQGLKGKHLQAGQSYGFRQIAI